MGMEIPSRITIKQNQIIKYQGEVMMCYKLDDGARYEYPSSIKNLRLAHSKC